MISTIFAMAIFSFVMSFSPGPVNLISLSVGLSRGFKLALPFVSGATIGFTLLLFCIGLGLDTTKQLPTTLNILSIIGSLFIIYMGYKMSKSCSIIELENNDLPSFSDGALLQLLNPKAWAACWAGVTAFDTADDFFKLVLFTTIYFAICYIGIGSWAFIGGKIFKKLDPPLSVIILNKIMGISLILVGIFLLIQRFLK